MCQGALGDCWLLAAISAIAEFPNYIEQRIFVENRISDDGCYHLNFYDVSSKSWIVLEIDDFIPCHEQKWWQASARPLFAQPNGNELYILLLEKAFAKYSGKSYAKLNLGFEPFAWMHLTGCEDQQAWCRNDESQNAGTWFLNVVDADAHRAKPHDMQTVQWVQHDDTHPDEAMFDFLLKSDASNYIMGATIPGSEIEKARTDGLVERHAYSVLSVKCFDAEETEEAKGIIKLVQCRNPWGGAHEWNGAWSDSSELWSQYPHLDKKLRAGRTAAEPDGSFWMSWADFHGAFRFVYVSPFDMGVLRGSHRAGRYNAE